MCEEGSHFGAACIESEGDSRVSRQQCINLGCCWRDGGTYGDDSLSHSPVECFKPAQESVVLYAVIDGRVKRARGGGSAEEEEEGEGKGEGEEFALVLNYRSSHKVTAGFWDRHHQTFLDHFPPKSPPSKAGR